MGRSASSLLPRCRSPFRVPEYEEYRPGRAPSVLKIGSRCFTDDFIFAANHLAVAAIETPNAAASAHVAIVNAFRAQLFRAANIVNVIGVSAVNDDVVLFELRTRSCQRRVHDSRGDHQPDCARLLEFSSRNRSSESDPVAPSPTSCLTDSGAAVVHHAAVPIANPGGAPCWHPSAPDRSFRVAFCLLLRCELFEGTSS